MKNNQAVIYILTNPSFPDYIKIGYASNIERRLKELNRSETIPFAFRVYAVYEVDSNLTDKELHKLIDTINPELRTIETFDGKERVKEFYAMSAEDAYSLLECIAKISGTLNRLKRMKPEGHEILDQEIADEIRNSGQRSSLRFSDIGIKPGEKLQWFLDESIEVTVVDDRHIEYEGEITSTSALAQRLLKKSYPLQGTLRFKYKGEILNDIRNRMGV